MELTVINQNSDFWNAKSDTAYPALSRYGYDVYAETGDLDNQSKWIYVIMNNSNSQIVDIPTGYEYSHTITPLCGFSNTGNTLKWPSGELGIYLLTKAYPALDIFYGVDENDPLDVTYDQIYAIDLTGIPESDFKFIITGGCINNMAIEPYLQHFDVNGNPLYTVDGKERWVLKTF